MAPAKVSEDFFLHKGLNQPQYAGSFSILVLGVAPGFYAVETELVEYY
jgi:hypothetical protein